MQTDKQVESLRGVVTVSYAPSTERPTVFPLISICIFTPSAADDDVCFSRKLVASNCCAITADCIRGEMCIHAHDLLTAYAGVEFLLRPSSTASSAENQFPQQSADQEPSIVAVLANRISSGNTQRNSWKPRHELSLHGNIFNRFHAIA